MKSTFPRSAFLSLFGVASLAAWGFLQWRARKRVEIAADRTAKTVSNGPLINCEDKSIQRRILDRALRRASKWITFRTSTDASPMVGQVGGLSVHKRPILFLEPEYVLKPLHLDHRGIREVAFYEAIRVVSQNKSSQDYLEWILGKGSSSTNSNKQNISQNQHNVKGDNHDDRGGTGSSQLLNTPTATLSNRVKNCFDKVAMLFAILWHDPIVTEEAENEQILVHSQKCVKKEIEVLRKLANFTTNYYGVIGQKSPVRSAPYGIIKEGHLLLQDITINFSKPCVVDLKMGTQCYEPDAPQEKKNREIAKFPQQFQFGFRIVGMRIHDPSHPDADETGYRRFSKEYGRTLESREQLSNALRIYFSAGCSITDETAAGMSAASKELIRARSISNLLVQLNMIQRLFDENKSISFIASSLLMVYEGDVSVGNRDVTNIKMIDFGRVRRDSRGDSGYKLGLRTIRHMLSKILKDEIGRIASNQPTQIHLC